MVGASPSPNAIWAFYYIQGEDGEDRSHPNAYRIPRPANSTITLADVHHYFPLPDPSAFHFRFRLNTTASKVAKYSRADSHNPGGTASSSPRGASEGVKTYYWLDIIAPGQSIPLVNGRVICKLLRLERTAKTGLVFRRKPVLIRDCTLNPINKTKETTNSIPSQNRHVATLSVRATNSAQQSPRRAANDSEKCTEKSTDKKIETSSESFEDFLSGGAAAKSVSSPSQEQKDLNLMSDHVWKHEVAINLDAPSKNKYFMQTMDPLAHTNPPNQKAVIQERSPAPSFEDDGGQTVGPVTLAEIREHCTSSSDGSNVYNASLVDKSTKSEEVRRAMEERERKMQEEVAKAQNALRKRDEAQRIISAQKEKAHTIIGPKLKAWAEDNGRIKNIRTLLSTMHLVIWEDSKWQEVNMGKLIQPSDVKRVYRKAMIVVHPDKSSGRNAEQLLIAERIFAAVNTAWDDFAKTNAC